MVKAQANKKTIRKKAWDKKIKIKLALKVVEEIKPDSKRRKSRVASFS